MATVNHVVAGNYTFASAPLRLIWRLTRSMKKAGWKYMASSNGSSKGTSKDPGADFWGAGVTTNAGASAASIAAPTRGRATVTGLTGITSSDKGRFILISGAATAANNHQHQIEEVLSSTSVRIDARTFAVASDANNGSLTWAIRDPTSETSVSRHWDSMVVCIWPFGHQSSYCVYLNRHLHSRGERCPIDHGG